MEAFTLIMDIVYKATGRKIASVVCITQEIAVKAKRILLDVAMLSVMVAFLVEIYSWRK